MVRSPIARASISCALVLSACATQTNDQKPAAVAPEPALPVVARTDAPELDPCTVELSDIEGRSRAYVLAALGEPDSEIFEFDVRLTREDVSALNALQASTFGIDDVARLRFGSDGSHRLAAGDRHTSPPDGTPQNYNHRRTTEFAWGLRLAERLGDRGVDLAAIGQRGSSFESARLVGRELTYNCNDFFLLLRTLSTRGRYLITFDEHDVVTFAIER